MDYAFSIALIVTEFFALRFAADAFFIRRKLGVFRLLMLLLTMVTAIIMIGMLTKEQSVIMRAPINITILFLTLCTSHEGAFGYKLFLSMAYYAIISVLDYFVMALSILYFSISYAEMVGDSILYLTGAFIAKSILITTAYCLKRFLGKTRKSSYASPPLIGLLLCVPCFSILSALVLIDTAVRTASISTWTFLVGVGLLVCNLVMFFLWDKLEDANQLRTENVLLQQQVRNRMEQVSVLENTYAKQRRLTHDFYNHARTLQGLLDAKNYEQAANYIQQWTKYPPSAVQVVHTNNRFADVICNQKYEEAQQKGVSISFLIEDLSDFPLKDDDLVTLLANAFDNAIEAAAACSAEKTIRIKIQQRLGNRWIISIRNTSSPVKIIGDNIGTTKAEAKEHGFGLQNMRRIVQQYHGDFSLSYADGWFQLTTVFHESM